MEWFQRHAESQLRNFKKLILFLCFVLIPSRCVSMTWQRHQKLWILCFSVENDSCWFGFSTYLKVHLQREKICRNSIPTPYFQSQNLGFFGVGWGRKMASFSFSCIWYCNHPKWSVMFLVLMSMLTIKTSFLEQKNTVFLNAGPNAPIWTRFYIEPVVAVLILVIPGGWICVVLFGTRKRGDIGYMLSMKTCNYRVQT